MPAFSIKLDRVPQLTDEAKANLKRWVGTIGHKEATKEICACFSIWTVVILMVSEHCTMPVVEVRRDSSLPYWRKGWSLMLEGN